MVSLISHPQRMPRFGLHSPSCNCTPRAPDKSYRFAPQSEVKRKEETPLLIRHRQNKTSPTWCRAFIFSWTTSLKNCGYFANTNSNKELGALLCVVEWWWSTHVRMLQMMPFCDWSFSGLMKLSLRGKAFTDLRMEHAIHWPVTVKVHIAPTVPCYSSFEQRFGPRFFIFCLVKNRGKSSVPRFIYGSCPLV